MTNYFLSIKIHFFFVGNFLYQNHRQYRVSLSPKFLEFSRRIARVGPPSSIPRIKGTAMQMHPANCPALCTLSRLREPKRCVASRSFAGYLIARLAARDNRPRSKSRPPMRDHDAETPRYTRPTPQDDLMPADVHFLRGNEALPFLPQPSRALLPRDRHPSIYLPTLLRSLVLCPQPPPPAASIADGCIRDAPTIRRWLRDLMFHIYSLICILRAGLCLEVAAAASSSSRTLRRLECVRLDCRRRR